MKKKNLLTLGALCLSLGLVVSSCNNTPEKGDPGTPGQDGKPGVDGKDGKTYKDVIVIYDDNLTGGVVEQSVFFVTEGQHDSVTFTFTAENPDEFIVSLEINNQLVTDLVPGSTSYTLADADVYQGSIQVTGAVFGDALSVSTKLLEEHWNSMVANDSQIVTTDDTGVETPAADKQSEYADKTLEGVYKKGLEDIGTALSELEEDATIEEKLTAGETAANEAIKALDEAYAEVLADAKVLAEGHLEALDAALTQETFLDEDRKTILDQGKAAIDAATTLEGLSKIVNGSALTADAQYNKLYNLKNQALNQIAAYLDTPAIKGYVEEFADEGTKAALEEWGVSLDQDPAAIAKTYTDQISEATSIEVNEDGEIVLVNECKTAIDAATKGVKETLLANIKAAYLAEVDNSKVLADQPNAATTIKGVIETVCSNYIVLDKDTKNLSDYVGTTEEGQLIYDLEVALAKVITQSGNVAFSNERLANAKQDAIEAFEAKVNEIKADTGYVSAVSYKEAEGVVTPTVKEYTLDSTANPAVKIDNPLFDVTGDTEKTYSLPEVSGLQISEASSTSTGSGAVLSGYSVEDWLGELKEATIAGTYPVLEVKKWETAHTGDFEKIYDAAKALYVSALRAESLPDANGTYVTTEQVGNKFDEAVKDKTFDEILDIAQSTTSSSDSLVTLDNAIASDVKARDVKDNGYKAFFDGGDTVQPTSNSSYRAAVNDMISKLLTGEASESDVTSFVTKANLDSLYASDVNDYLTDAKDVFAQIYQNTIAGASVTVEQYRNYQKVYNDYISFIGAKIVKDESGAWVLDEENGKVVYPCDTLHAVNKWLDDARNSLGKSGTTPTYEVSADVVVEGVEEGTLTIGGVDITLENDPSLKFEVTSAEGSQVNIKVTGKTVSAGKELAASSWGEAYKENTQVFLFRWEKTPGYKVVTYRSTTAENYLSEGIKEEKNQTSSSFLTLVAVSGAEGSKANYNDKDFLTIEIYDAAGSTVVKTIQLDFSELVTTGE